MLLWQYFVNWGWLPKYHYQQMQSHLGQIKDAAPYPYVMKAPLSNTCVRSTMLYGGETSAPNESDLQRLQYNDRAILLWSCGVKAMDGFLSEDFLAKLQD